MNYESPSERIERLLASLSNKKSNEIFSWIGITPKDYNEDYIFEYSLPNMANINDQAIEKEFKIFLTCISNEIVSSFNFHKLILRLVVASSWNQQIFNKFKHMESTDLLETDLLKVKNQSTVQLLDNYSRDQLNLIIFSICTLIMRLQHKNTETTKLKYLKLNQIIQKYCPGIILPFLDIEWENVHMKMQMKSDEYLAALAWIIMNEENNPNGVFNKIAQFTLLETICFEGLPLYSSGQQLLDALNVKDIDHFYDIFLTDDNENGLKEFVKFSKEVKNYQNSRWKYARIFNDGYFNKMGFKVFSRVCLMFYYSLGIRTNSNVYEKVLNGRKNIIQLDGSCKNYFRRLMNQWDLLNAGYLDLKQEKNLTN